MSGGADSHKMEDILEDPEIDAVMARFKVNDKTAEDIIKYAVEKAQARFERWQNNLMRRVNQRLREMEEQYKKDLEKKA